MRQRSSIFVPAAILSFVAVPWVFGGCATAEETQRPPEARALTAGRENVDRARSRALSRSDALDGYSVRVRRNPPPCEAPPTEIFAHGRWTRVYLVVGEADDEVVQRLADGSEPGPIPKFVVGAWEGEREAETGVTYPVFAVDGIEEVRD